MSTKADELLDGLQEAVEMQQEVLSGLADQLKELAALWQEQADYWEAKAKEATYDFSGDNQ